MTIQKYELTAEEEKDLRRVLFAVAKGGDKEAIAKLDELYDARIWTQAEVDALNAFHKGGTW